MERLTKRAENGMPYLAKVKDGETAVEGSYNTLKCIQEAFEALAKYEELEEQGQILKLPQPLTELAKFEILLQYQEGEIAQIIHCTDCTFSNHCDIQDVLDLYDEPENLFCSQGELRE